MHNRLKVLSRVAALSSLLIPLWTTASTVVFAAEGSPSPDAAAKHVELKFPTEGSLSIDVVRTPDSEVTRKIYEQTRKLFAAHDFQSLEELGTKLCAEKQTLTTGGWVINAFFQSIKSQLNDTMPDDAWEGQLNILQDWMKKKPQSILAKTALMDFWTGYAWKARGSGWANTVSEEGWKLFAGRLAKAQALMTDADSLPQTCPTIYKEELVLARGNSWDRAQMEHVFSKSERKFPTYLSSYAMKYAYLMPRWGGQEGDCEQFLNESADKHGKGKEGDKFYARLIWNLDANGFAGAKVFTETTLSWDRTKSGFEAILKEQPNSISVLSEFAKLADYADDKPKARQLFAKLGNKCDDSVWARQGGWQKWYFTKAKQHAQSANNYKQEKESE